MYSTYARTSSIKESKIMGSVFIKYNGLKQTAFEKKQWDKSLVAKVENKYVSEKGEKSYLGYARIKDILFRKDGKMLVLMEQLLHDNKAIAGSSPMQFRHEWHYEDFIVQCLDPEKGNLIWWSSFKKAQDFSVYYRGT